MNEPNESRRGIFADAEYGANILLWLTLFWSTIIKVFLHNGIGRRYLRINVIGGALLIPIFSCYCPPQDVGYLGLLWLAFLFMVAVRQVQAASPSARRCHSQYNGFPWLMRFTWCESEVDFKRFWEPLIVFLTGFLVSAINLPLGSFLIWGAICMFIRGSIVNAYNQMRLDDARDAMIEQEVFAEQLNSRFRR